MATAPKTLTNRLMVKLSLTFLLLVVLMGVLYVVTSIYFTNRYFAETSQQLNASLAEHLIEEKFQNASPFLEDGAVNKALFGDLMHDMMAVNRTIEVYLLDDAGGVLYSVVLDHTKSDRPVTSVALEPIKEFINSKGSAHVLGDDPRMPDQQKIFSAAPYNVDGRTGYVYIVLAGQELAAVQQQLASSYFMRLGIGASLLTMLFAALIGFISIWFLTKNLRSIIHAVRRFREGDTSVRIENAATSDVAVLATTFNDMADTLENNIEEIQGVDRLRRELIANVSHDLRTPLAILKGYIETLQIKKDTLSVVEQEAYLHIIEDSSDRLANLITQLFEYSKLEAKQIAPNKEPFSIADLAGDLVASNRVIAEKKGIALTLSNTAQTPLVFADISLVERAIQNLLDNALKFTPQNGSITLELQPTDTNVSISVRDTGPGISEVEQAHIFERYKQTRTDHARQGVGLGLAIVKKIMELHNTSIRVESSASTGSVFQFALPVPA